jgi:hypothetical protein
VGCFSSTIVPVTSVPPPRPIVLTGISLTASVLAGCAILGAPLFCGPEDECDLMDAGHGVGVYAAPACDQVTATVLDVCSNRAILVDAGVLLINYIDGGEPDGGPIEWACGQGGAPPLDRASTGGVCQPSFSQCIDSISHASSCDVALEIQCPGLIRFGDCGD